MNTSELDAWFLKQDEPAQSCLLYLRKLILSLDPGITEVWRYKMPFYCYRGKRFCYLWYHRQLGKPYVGAVDGYKITDPAWISEKRSRMKIFLIDPSKNIPAKKITTMLRSLLRD